MLNHLDRLHATGVDFDLNGNHEVAGRDLGPQPVMTSCRPLSEQPQVMRRVVIHDDFDDGAGLDRTDPLFDVHRSEVEHGRVQEPELGRQTPKRHDGLIRGILAIVQRREDLGIEATGSRNGRHAFVPEVGDLIDE